MSDTGFSPIKLLLVIASVFRGVAYVTLCGGIIVALGLFFSNDADSLMAASMVFVFSTVSFLFVMALSEFIRIAISIETNTDYYPAFLRWLVRSSSGSLSPSSQTPDPFQKP